MIYLLAQICILGRANTPLYHAEIPTHWRQEPREFDLKDTTFPIAAFKVENVTVTIHNFPFINIAPSLQVERWHRQLGSEPNKVTPTTHSGFTGLILESDQMIAAAFELAPYYQARIEPSEKTASWTIKATGPVSAIRTELLKLIHTFEPIEEFRCP